MKLREDPSGGLVDRVTFDFEQSLVDRLTLVGMGLAGALPATVLLGLEGALGLWFFSACLWFLVIVALGAVRRGGTVVLTTSEVRIERALRPWSRRTTTTLPSQDLRLEWSPTVALFAVDSWDVAFTTPTGRVPIPSVRCRREALERFRDTFVALRAAGQEAAGSPADVPEALRRVRPRSESERSWRERRSQ